MQTADARHRDPTTTTPIAAAGTQNTSHRQVNPGVRIVLVAVSAELQTKSNSEVAVEKRRAEKMKQQAQQQQAGGGAAASSSTSQDQSNNSDNNNSAAAGGGAGGRARAPPAPPPIIPDEFYGTRELSEAGKAQIKKSAAAAFEALHIASLATRQGNQHQQQEAPHQYRHGDDMKVSSSFIRNRNDNNNNIVHSNLNVENSNNTNAAENNQQHNDQHENCTAGWRTPVTIYHSPFQACIQAAEIFRTFLKEKENERQHSDLGGGGGVANNQKKAKNNNNNDEQEDQNQQSREEADEADGGMRLPEPSGYGGDLSSVRRSTMESQPTYISVPQGWSNFSFDGGAASGENNNDDDDVPTIGGAGMAGARRGLARLERRRQQERNTQNQQHQQNQLPEQTASTSSTTTLQPETSSSPPSPSAETTTHEQQQQDQQQSEQQCIPTIETKSDEIFFLKGFFENLFLTDVHEAPSVVLDSERWNTYRQHVGSFFSSDEPYGDSPCRLAQRLVPFCNTLQNFTMQSPSSSQRRQDGSLSLHPTRGGGGGGGGGGAGSNNSPTRRRMAATMSSAASQMQQQQHSNMTMGSADPSTVGGDSAYQPVDRGDHDEQNHLAANQEEQKNRTSHNVNLAAAAADASSSSSSNRPSPVIILVTHPLILKAFVLVWRRFSPCWWEAEPVPPAGSVQLLDPTADHNFVFGGFVPNRAAFSSSNSTSNNSEKQQQQKNQQATQRPMPAAKVRELAIARGLHRQLPEDAFVQVPPFRPFEPICSETVTRKGDARYSFWTKHFSAQHTRNVFPTLALSHHLGFHQIHNHEQHHQQNRAAGGGGARDLNLDAMTSPQTRLNEVGKAVMTSGADFGASDPSQSNFSGRYSDPASSAGQSYNNQQQRNYGLFPSSLSPSSSPTSLEPGGSSLQNQHQHHHHHHHHHQQRPQPPHEPKKAELMIILVRNAGAGHAFVPEAEYARAATGEIVNDFELPLTSFNKQEARRCARELRKILEAREEALRASGAAPGYTRLWTSNYQRARETSDILLEELNPSQGHSSSSLGGGGASTACSSHRRPLIHSLRESVFLSELQLGLAHGRLNLQETAEERELSDRFDRWPNERYFRRPIYGESLQECCMRMSGILSDIDAGYRFSHGKAIHTVVIVSHCDVIRSFIATYMSYSSSWFSSEPKPPPCSIQIIMGGRDYGYTTPSSIQRHLAVATGRFAGHPLSDNNNDTQQIRLQQHHHQQYENENYNNNTGDIQFRNTSVTGFATGDDDLLEPASPLHLSVRMSPERERAICEAISNQQHSNNNYNNNSNNGPTNQLITPEMLLRVRQQQAQADLNIAWRSVIPHQLGYHLGFAGPLTLNLPPCGGYQVVIPAGVCVSIDRILNHDLSFVRSNRSSNMINNNNNNNNNNNSNSNNISQTNGNDDSFPSPNSRHRRFRNERLALAELNRATIDQGGLNVVNIKVSEDSVSRRGDPSTSRWAPYLPIPKQIDRRAVERQYGLLPSAALSPNAQGAGIINNIISDINGFENDNNSPALYNNDINASFTTRTYHMQRFETADSGIFGNAVVDVGPAQHARAGDVASVAGGGAASSSVLASQLQPQQCQPTTANAFRKPTCRVILVRHGKSQVNENQSVMQNLGLVDSVISLVEDGVHQAQVAGAELRRYLLETARPNERATRMLVSPFQRTRQTAEEILKILNPSEPGEKRLVDSVVENSMISEKSWALTEGGALDATRAEVVGIRVWCGQPDADVVQRQLDAFETGNFTEAQQRDGRYAVPDPGVPFLVLSVKDDPRTRRPRSAMFITDLLTDAAELRRARGLPGATLESAQLDKDAQRLETMDDDEQSIVTLQHILKWNEANPEFCRKTVGVLKDHLQMEVYMYKNTSLSSLWKHPSGESIIDVAVRMTQVTQDLRRDYDQQNVTTFILVTHGDACRGFLAAWLGLPVRFCHSLVNRNCHIYEISGTRGSRPSLLRGIFGGFAHDGKTTVPASQLTHMQYRREVGWEEVKVEE